ncbi:hypothetical protein V6N13_147101 [Hibiscus sabdariffa]|uniref:Partial AB-hydrolase lipase domain-containing protein n=1 Tax=Hibiscus sabdariffa TaxID=183260 RepID=A0ABR2TUZ9_9ROSI
MPNFSSVLTFFVLFFVLANASAIDKVFPGNAIINSSINDDDTICKSLVQTQGYACEEHRVTTEDGYILSVQRIPAGRSGKTANKPPVLLQHGIFAGTLIALASFSQQEELINMFRSAALLCPIAYLNQIQSQLTKFAAQLHMAEGLYNLGYHEFPPGWDVLGPILEKICNETGSNCSDIMPALTVIRTGIIAMYDYGSEDENKKHYGNPNPPAYDMRNIPREFPLFLGYGGQDMLAGVDNVKALLKDLKDHDKGKLFQVYSEEYAHADFVLGVNASQVVYHPMISFFNLH